MVPVERSQQTARRIDSEMGERRQGNGRDQLILIFRPHPRSHHKNHCLPTFSRQAGDFGDILREAEKDLPDIGGVELDAEWTDEAVLRISGDHPGQDQSERRGKMEGGRGEMTEKDWRSGICRSAVWRGERAERTYRRTSPWCTLQTHRTALSALCRAQGARKGRVGSPLYGVCDGRIDPTV